MCASKSEYLFGDTSLAAQRLDLLHAIFAPTSQSFLLQHKPEQTLRAGTAVDVGCGIGCTTELLQRTTAPQITVGIDSSAAFLKIAAARHPACSFVRADVARGIAGHKLGIVYGRYVLLHLQQPLSVLSAWCTSLAPRGRLLLEENLGYETGNPVLADYMETAAAVMQANRQDLYLGRLLQHWKAPAGFRIVDAGRCDVSVSASRAATVFSMNFPAWSERARAHRGDAWLTRLAESLERESNDHRHDAAITWNLLQLVVERDPVG